MTVKTELQQLSEDLEHFETDPWAPRALLKKELLTYRVIDPCVGGGVLTKALLEADYDVHTCDIHDWRNPRNLEFGIDHLGDYLDLPADFAARIKDATIFMNPPFSKAEEFVMKSIEYGARKIVCFNRFSWWESQDRRTFWQELPPNRIYICGDRAHCWRHDLPRDEKGNRFDPVTGKKLAGTPTAHAFFIWERGQPAGTLMGHIYKADAA